MSKPGLGVRESERYREVYIEKDTVCVCEGVGGGGGVRKKGKVRNGTDGSVLFYGVEVKPTRWFTCYILT